MNKTYFIHVKKEMGLLHKSTDDLINLIKQNIKEQLNENILEEDIKLLNEDKIKEYNIDKIGSIVTNKKNIKCNICDKKIINNTKVKLLDCGDVFHIKCINNHLKESLYKNCPCCNIEYISNIINNEEIDKKNQISISSTI